MGEKWDLVGICIGFAWEDVNNVSSMNSINAYIFEIHGVEEALKERHLIAKGVSSGYIDISGCEV